MLRVVSCAGQAIVVRNRAERGAALGQANSRWGGPLSLALLLGLSGLGKGCREGNEFDELRKKEQVLQVKLASEKREFIEAERARQLEKIDADKRRRHSLLVAKLAEMKPWDRAAQLATCARGGTKCPETQEPDIFLEAAANDSERKSLAVVWKLNRKPEAVDPLNESTKGRKVRCCDKTLASSCTCGGPLRGCCDRHRGVCGCE
jgi:hypothetical protein